MHEKEQEKNYENRYLWYNRDRYVKNVGLKNACKIGIVNKHNYVVHLSMVNKKEVMVVHTLIEKEGDIIEKLEGEVARKMFMRLSFF